MKLKINCTLDKKAETLTDMFGVSEERVRKIGEFVDSVIRTKTTSTNLMRKVLEEYTGAEALIAVGLVWYVTMMEASFQAELAQQMDIARMGARMPQEIQ